METPLGTHGLESSPRVQELLQHVESLAADYYNSDALKDEDREELEHLFRLKRVPGIIRKHIDAIPVMVAKQLGHEVDGTVLESIAATYVTVVLREIRKRMDDLIAHATLEDLRRWRDDFPSTPEKWRYSDPRIDEEQDLYVLAAMVRELRRAGAITAPGDFKDSRTGRYDVAADFFDHDEGRQMETIYRLNYADNPELREALIAGFRTPHGTDDRIYTWHLSGFLLSFNRFWTDGLDARGRRIRHFSAMNVQADVHGNAIGDMLMDATLGEELADGNTVIAAECDAASGIASHYINERGFVVTGCTPDYHGITKLDIVLDQRLDGACLSDAWDDDEVAERYRERGPRFSEGGNDVVIASSPSLEQTDFGLLNEGYVITRVARHGDDVLVVFEHGLVEPGTYAVVTAA